MIPVISIGDAIEVRVYARTVTWFSWRTGATKLWPMVVAMFCLLLPACMGDVWYVDSRFTPEEEQHIQAAADLWQDVGSGPIDFVWNQKVDVRDTGRRVIVRVNDRLAQEFCAEPIGTIPCEGMHRRTTNVEFIILNTDRDPTLFERVAAHELGHSLIGRVDGLTDEHGHLPEPGALMFHYSDAEHPTPEDVRAMRVSRTQR